MDRIQSAIEKARRARSQRLAAEDPPAPATGVPVEAPGQGGSGQGGPAPAAPAPVVLPAAAAAAQPAPEPQPPPPADAAALAAAWQAITAVTPDRRALERGRIVAAAGGPAAIAFDVMRTRLLQQLRGQGWRRVAVTSPGAGCGKTMTCLNLAFSLARQADLRVLVVELDLRRPAILATLGLRARPQFAAALEGREPPEAHLLRLGPNLALAASHAPARLPAELLQGQKAAAVLDALEARLAPDVVLFDTPPMLVSDDTLGLLDLVDGALLVAAAERSTIEEIDRCEQELSARTGVLGVVLNKCRYMGREENYGYY
ncbi:MAG TPA: CpsD/CapB family tyrosine-protein kinase [Paracoccaceae bacterium]|nr:CpsD/CapB family tyrosine-protein kinase [Paracoccaceae bacterium]